MWAALLLLAVILLVLCQTPVGLRTLRVLGLDSPPRPFTEVFVDGTPIPATLPIGSVTPVTVGFVIGNGSDVDAVIPWRAVQVGAATPAQTGAVPLGPRRRLPQTAIVTVRCTAPSAEITVTAGQDNATISRRIGCRAAVPAAPRAGGR